MARYPHAHWRPLPEASTEPLITATQVILHTAVSSAASLFGYFSRDDVDLESHFYVNQTGVEQYIDTGRQADANRTANVRAISIETWDNADPDHTPWTPTQMSLLVDLVAWACRTHNIPARQCPAHDAPGIGWHVMFGAPGPWTPVQKSCPGNPRIAQMPELIRRVQAALAGQPPEDDMPTIPEINDAAKAGQLDHLANRIATVLRDRHELAHWNQATTVADLVRELGEEDSPLRDVVRQVLVEELTTRGSDVRKAIRELAAMGATDAAKAADAG